MRRLDVLDEPIDVVLGGGVLTAGHALLMDEIDRLLHAAGTAGDARPSSQAPPVVGAALLGLDRIEAADGAHQRLRESFRVPAL